METARIHDLIRLGPNERIIFERDAPTPEAIARLIASLANTHGGTILFGIDRRKAVVGLRNPQAALSKITRGAQLVTPPILIEPRSVELDGATLIALDVPQGTNAPYTAPDGRILVRAQRGSAPASDQQAAELARRAFTGALLMPLGEQRRLQAKNAPPVDLEHILLKLEHLIIANAELTRKLDEANSWQSRMADQLIGAALGLIVSVALFYLGLGG
ncbi:MAG TPA: ATP-binding protein [Herpetosiphonaceae bacterium]